MNKASSFLHHQFPYNNITILHQSVDKLSLQLPQRTAGKNDNGKASVVSIHHEWKLLSLRFCKEKWDHFFFQCVKPFVEKHNENTRYCYEWTDILVILKSPKLSCHLLLLFKNHLCSTKWVFVLCQKCHITGWDSWYDSHPRPSLRNQSAFNTADHKHTKELEV